MCSTTISRNSGQGIRGHKISTSVAGRLYFSLDSAQCIFSISFWLWGRSRKFGSDMSQINTQTLWHTVFSSVTLLIPWRDWNLFEPTYFSALWMTLQFLSTNSVQMRNEEVPKCQSQGAGDGFGTFVNLDPRWYTGPQGTKKSLCLK